MNNFIWVLVLLVGLSGVPFQVYSVVSSLVEMRVVDTGEKQWNYCEYVYEDIDDVLAIKVRPNGETTLGRYMNLQFKDVGYTVSNLTFSDFDLTNVSNAFAFSKVDPSFVIDISMTLTSSDEIDITNVQCVFETRRYRWRTPKNQSRSKTDGATVKNCVHENLQFSRSFKVSLTQSQVDAILKMSFEKKSDPIIIPKSDYQPCIDAD